MSILEAGWSGLNALSTLIASEVLFFSACDEDAFFAWLDKLNCIIEYCGEGIALHITLNVALLDDSSLRELLALFFRYGVEMTQLARFATDVNCAWFRKGA
jgi:hypothetical protein